MEVFGGDGTTASPAAYAYHADHQGSVRTLSDGSGQAVGSYDYESYGGLLSASEPTALADHGDQPFGYTGRGRDRASGLYHYRARAYDPETGVFLQEDPQWFGGGDYNVYRYVGSSPLRYTDPSGLSQTAERNATLLVAGALATGAVISQQALTNGGMELATELDTGNASALAAIGGKISCTFHGLASVFGGGSYANCGAETAARSRDGGGDDADGGSPPIAVPGTGSRNGGRCPWIRENICRPACDDLVLESPSNWKRRTDQGMKHARCVQQCMYDAGCGGTNYPEGWDGSTWGGVRPWLGKF